MTKVKWSGPGWRRPGEAHITIKVGPDEFHPCLSTDPSLPACRDACSGFPTAWVFGFHFQPVVLFTCWVLQPEQYVHPGVSRAMVWGPTKVSIPITHWDCVLKEIVERDRTKAQYMSSGHYMSRHTCANTTEVIFSKLHFWAEGLRSLATFRKQVQCPVPTWWLTLSVTPIQRIKCPLLPLWYSVKTPICIKTLFKPIFRKTHIAFC